MKIWIPGASGMLGSHLREILTVPFVGTNRNQLDLTNLKTIKQFTLSQDISHIINCAAYTLVDQAEEEQEKAFQVNTLGPKHLGIISQKYHIPIVHISTDYVFDGSSTMPYRENDATHPLNVYGLTKLQGEKALLEETEHACIIRTSWLFGNYGNHFVKTMIRLMQEREELGVISDQIGCPTYAKDLARILFNALNLRGLYNFANADETSWYGFAKKIEELGRDFKIKKIRPIPFTEYQTKAKRPPYSVLCTKKIEEALEFKARSWKEALTECMEGFFVKTT